jgi:single-strand DNA-binding protein
MNRVILIGNLGRDVEVRYTTGGDPVVNLALATNKKIKGEDVTEWHRVVAFKKTAELLTELTKGTKLAVEGEIRTRKWTDKDQIERYSTEVVAHFVEFLSPKGQQQAAPQQAPAKPKEEPPQDNFDDDIPF